MKDNPLFGCTADIRPVVCKFESNVCCLTCEHNKECTEEILNNPEIKVRALPCNADEHFEEDEICEFGV